MVLLLLLLYNDDDDDDDDDDEEEEEEEGKRRRRSLTQTLIATFCFPFLHLFSAILKQGHSPQRLL